jgi:hypothetical protein
MRGGGLRRPEFAVAAELESQAPPRLSRRRRRKVISTMTGWLLGYDGWQRPQQGRSIAMNSPDGPPRPPIAGPYFPKPSAADIPRRARRNYVSEEPDSSPMAPW